VNIPRYVGGWNKKEKKWEKEGKHAVRVGNGGARQAQNFYKKPSKLSLFLSTPIPFLALSLFVFSSFPSTSSTIHQLLGFTFSLCICIFSITSTPKMDVRRRFLPASGDRVKTQKLNNNDTLNNSHAPSQTLLPLYLTNALFFGVFFSVAYFLLHRWRDKIRTATPLHAVTPTETAAIVSLVASAVYLLGFFGFASRASLDELSDEETILREDSRAPGPCPAALLDSPKKQNQIPLPLSTSVDKSMELSNPPPLKAVDEAAQAPAPSPISLSPEDKEVVEAVVSGSVPSYALESRLGDCGRAASIRREAVQRLTGRSLEGLPVQGFDYESILGQCCEMPIGFVQIPVGVAGPLLLDGKEYTVPMATTEGCLVASTNRGCKAIYVSGGASSVLLRDGMTRAPVVSLPSAQRAAQLKFFLEDPLNYDSLSVVFNKYSLLLSLSPSLFFFLFQVSSLCSDCDALHCYFRNHGPMSLARMRLTINDCHVLEDVSQTSYARC